MIPTGIEPLLPALHGAVAIYDERTARHSTRVAAWAAALARQLGLSPDEVEAASWAGLLHDIGKLGVTIEILRKPGSLNLTEWAEMLRHPNVGADVMLAVSADLAPMADAVLTHHERWDGRGYPQGRSGGKIPLLGRVLAICDAFDTTTHRRTYQAGVYSPAEALRELRSAGGTQFDPELVPAFAEICSNRMVLSVEALAEDIGVATRSGTGG